MLLVTGCAGFIGSNLCEYLLKKEIQVVGIDNFDPYYDISLKKRNLKYLKKYRNFIFLPLDITKKSSVMSLFQKYNFSHVIHLAARPGVSKSLRKPLVYEHINVFGTLVLLEAVKEVKNTVFIFGSSSSVYGETGSIPFTESQQLCPISPYGVSKANAEIYCRLYHKLYGIPITILRLFTVYGPRVRPDMAVIKFINSIIQGKPITLYNSGNVKRDYTYIDDVVDGISSAIEKRLSFEIINIGGSYSTEMIKIVELLERYLGIRAWVNSLPLPKAEVSKTQADIKKAKRLLGWSPKITLEQGFSNVVNWYRSVYK